MEQLVEDMKNFGTANWILIACVVFVMLLLVVLVIINIKIMKKYRMDLTRSRLARVSAQVEVINNWCAIVVENTGQVAATNVKINAKGSIMDYYYHYIHKCRVDNVFKKILGKKFTLAPGDRKRVALFPLGPINKSKSIVESRQKVIVPEADVNLTNRVKPDTKIEIEQVFDKDDAKILKSVKKQEQKLADKKVKETAKNDKQYEKVEDKKAKAIQKANKKEGKATHKSTVAQPDMSKIARSGNIKIDIVYETLGYRFKSDYKVKNFVLKDYPMQANVNENILRAQKDLLEQVVFLQKQIYEAMNMKNDDFEK